MNDISPLRRRYLSEDYRDRLLPLRQQMTVRNDWLRERLDSFLPELMAREGFDMWLVIAREYNEDPVIMTLLPEPAMSARRRTILAFCRNADGTVDRLTLSRYAQKGFYESGWKPEDGNTQWEALAALVGERDPQTIGINISEYFAFGDGLTHYEYTQLVDALDKTYSARLKPADRLCVGWLERRIPAELTVYSGIVELGHVIIAEAFSNKVIHPGITTTDDVVWWMRQRMHDLGLRAWFQPSVDIQAHGEPFSQFYSEDEKRTLIQPGDLLWCDMGFVYLGLATDQQQHAYVLRPGEYDAPEGLKYALAEGNRLQEIHLEEMQVGHDGNTVLEKTLSRARAQGISAMVYSHPLGYHGHAAGPTIGLWDRQGGVPGRGDYELFDSTCYSIELNITRPIPEWDGQNVRIMLEEDAVLTGGEMRWLDGRQTQLHIIG